MFLEANNNGMDTRLKTPRIAIGAKFERVATGKEPLIKPVIPGFGNPKDNLWAQDEIEKRNITYFNKKRIPGNGQNLSVGVFHGQWHFKHYSNCPWWEKGEQDHVSKPLRIQPP